MIAASCTAERTIIPTLLFSPSHPIPIFTPATLAPSTTPIIAENTSEPSLQGSLAKGMKAGEYILYTSDVFNSNKNSITTWLNIKPTGSTADDQEQSIDISGYEASISSNVLILLPTNGSKLPVSMIDLQTGKEIHLSEEIRFCDSLDISPSKNEYIASCYSSNNSELYVFFNGNYLIKLTDCAAKQDECIITQIFS